MPYGSELISIDGQSPDKLLPALQDKLDRFDFKHKIFFGAAFSPVKDNFYLLLENYPKEFKFRTKEGKEVILRTDNPVQYQWHLNP